MSNYKKEEEKIESESKMNIATEEEMMLKHQLDYYFSEENLKADLHLLQHMDPETYYAPIKAILEFPRVQKYDLNIEKLADMLEGSAFLELNKERTHVRPVRDMVISKVTLLEPTVDDLGEEALMPILFNFPMVKAIIALRIIQTADQLKRWTFYFSNAEDAKQLYYILDKAELVPGIPGCAKIELDHKLFTKINLTTLITNARLKQKTGVIPIREEENVSESALIDRKIKEKNTEGSKDNMNYEHNELKGDIYQKQIYINQHTLKFREDNEYGINQEKYINNSNIEYERIENRKTDEQQQESYSKRNTTYRQDYGINSKRNFEKVHASKTEGDLKQRKMLKPEYPQQNREGLHKKFNLHKKYNDTRGGQGQAHKDMNNNLKNINTLETSNSEYKEKGLQQFKVLNKNNQQKYKKKLVDNNTKSQILKNELIDIKKDDNQDTKEKDLKPYIAEDKNIKEEKQSLPVKKDQEEISTLNENQHNEREYGQNRDQHHKKHKLYNQKNESNKRKTNNNYPEGDQNKEKGWIQKHGKGHGNVEKYIKKDDKKVTQQPVLRIDAKFQPLKNDQKTKKLPLNIGVTSSWGK